MISFKKNVFNKCYIATRCFELLSKSLVFCAGLICGVTTAGMVLIAVIAIIACTMR
jgi:hypothetical protein